MTIRIRIGDSDRIDFSRPIESTDEQVEKLNDFFKTIYNETVVEIENLDDDENFRTNRLGDKPGPQYPQWSNPENIALLDLDKTDEEEIAEEIGRTPIAVYMHRGYWIARFMDWAKGKNIYENTAELVKEFSEYLEAEKRNNREEKSRERRKRNERKNFLERKLHSLEKTKKIQEMMIKRLPSNSREYEEAKINVEREIEEITKELDNLL
jgi:flagellar biosynthesis GTPase FlhF